MTPANALHPTAAGALPPADFYRSETVRSGESVGYLVKCIMLSMAGVSDKRLSAHGLTSAQCGPLLRLRAAGKATVGELAHALAVDAGAMTRLLDRLERKRMVKRTRAGEDRRVVQIELTAEGEAVIADASAILDDVLHAHLAGFSSAECQELRAYLDRMLAAGHDMRTRTLP